MTTVGVAAWRGGVVPLILGAEGLLCVEDNGVVAGRAAAKIADEGFPLAPTVVQAPPVEGTEVV